MYTATCSLQQSPGDDTRILDFLISIEQYYTHFIHSLFQKFFYCFASQLKLNIASGRVNFTRVQIVFFVLSGNGFQCVTLKPEEGHW